MKRRQNGFLKLKIELPPTGILRTISVPASMTLENLNDAIQAVMGWEHDHLWHFQDGRRGPIYELPHKDEFAPFGRVLTLDASKARLEKVFPRYGSKLTYEYDFGDSWDHVVTRMADPRVAEIACLDSDGPDGLEDFGGQWRLAEFIRDMRENPENEEWSETRAWCGFEEIEELKTYLDGESTAAKTEKLRHALRDVKVEVPVPAVEKTPKISDEEQARTLGLLFATVVSVGVWDVLRDALSHGGKCTFADPDKTIATYLLSVFDGLKITDGVQTLFHVNPSKLKVHKKWVDWYSAHGESWEKMREPFDILESYASAAVHLYGVLTQVELYELILRYDPKIELDMDETMRYLESRARWSGIDYRIEGKLIVDNQVFSLDHEDPDADIEELRKAHREVDRWYPPNRAELFKWAFHVEYERTPEVMSVEMVLRSLCKLDGAQVEEVLDAIHDLIAGGVPPDGIYKSLVAAGLFERISTKPRQHLIDALEGWLMTIHVQCLNGHTGKDLREIALRKAQEPKISRNALCPCGSGKKYKLCCGRKLA